MKRERRHELQHNDLAEWILKAYERVAPYRNTILGVALLVTVLVIALALWHSHSVAEAGEAWDSLGIPVFQPQFADDSGRTIAEMQKVIQSHPGTPAAEWAEVFKGDNELTVGANKIMTDKKTGIAFLAQARDDYAKALETLTIPAAREQAMFGKARALESLIQNKDQLHEALGAYEDLNKSFPDGMFKAVAKQRIERLQKKDSDSLAFYEALAQYTPKPKVESPHSQLSKLGPLPENPPQEPVPTPPVRPDGKQSGVPEPSLTPTEPVKTTTPKTEAPKTETPKTELAKPPAAKPAAPKLDVVKPDAPKTETPKTEAPKKDK